MRSLRIVALTFVLALCACQDVKDVLAISAALQERYHMPATVGLNNGHHLTVTFQDAPIAALKLDDTGMKDFARGVASFAKSRFPRKDAIEDVTVQFAQVSNAGPITVTRTQAPFRFAASELP